MTISVTTYQDLMNTYLEDGARSTKYDVKLTIPYTSNGAYTFVSVLCKATSFPERAVISQEYTFRGHTIQVPVTTQYSGTWRCSFYVDEWHKIRSVFETWMESVETRAGDYKTFRDTSSAVSTSNMNLVVSGDGVVVEQYKFIDNIVPHGNRVFPTIKYKLYGVFPSSISAIDLSSDQEQIQTIDVEFKYTYYDVEKGTR